MLQKDYSTSFDKVINKIEFYFSMLKREISIFKNCHLSQVALSTGIFMKWYRALLGEDLITETFAIDRER